MNKSPLASKLSAEALGTFVLVFGGAGAAVFSASVIDDATGVNMGIGFLGVALAFGLTVVAMAYAVGHISGGHFNPAVTLGAALAGRLPWKLTVPYWIAQLVGGAAGGGLLLAIASGRPGYSLAENGLATNGYGEFSPAGYSMGAVFLTEVLLTAVFLYVILGTTDRRAPSNFAPLAIGLTLTLIHLVSIPVSNTSVNPARSFGVALFAGGDALGQVWLFFVAPLLGAAVAGLSYRLVFPNTSRVTEELPEPASDETREAI
ncbi:aquaporin Z [Micrococcus luteus]|uniref:aquaporin Z n=1 Tax=Micrococcus luteus TaxID=1270 RepID=UPI00203E6204|nr:aquaporin Z [Micrococcus luteus]MCM3577644.1 aquaporin Z [Micrococcus luteus]MCV7532353.1 aquaporin Z [Micrococcus luteus]